MVADWYNIDTIQEIDTPALVVYPDRVNENITILKSFLPDTDRLRPHVKTHKSPEITRLMMDAGITRFKCATIAEAEMLAQTGVSDILLAYQPIGPKIGRLAALTTKYPRSIFSCLIDNIDSARAISSIFEKMKMKINILIDLNVGMNRTGISPENGFEFYQDCASLGGINIVGLHAYDGHIRDRDLAIRTKHCDESFSAVITLRDKIKKETGKTLQIVAGGTPTFPIHAKRSDVFCSPGTFIYWDKGYQSILPEQPFLFAALVITRVVSIPAKDIICVDLGHKSIASENTIDKRVFFLNAQDVIPVSHSEEHMVLKTGSNHTYKIGDVLYGVPYHICPTVALHDRVSIINDRRVMGQWQTLSRNRTISV